jgi:hypothetical protein
VAPADHVEQAAGGGDHHIHAALERVDLRLDLHPAVDGDEADREADRQALPVLGDLQREFAGRDEHEGSRGAGLLSVEKHLDDRQHEGGRLAGPGLCGAENVAFVQRGRNGRRLNGRGMSKAHGPHVLLEKRVEVEV